MGAALHVIFGGVFCISLFLSYLCNSLGYHVRVYKREFDRCGAYLCGGGVRRHRVLREYLREYLCADFTGEGGDAVPAPDCAGGCAFALRFRFEGGADAVPAVDFGVGRGGEHGGGDAEFDDGE